MHTIHNARVQLIATILSNLGVAFLVVGFITPAVAGALSGGLKAVFTLAWISFGVILHRGAYLVLGRLRQ